MSELEINNIKYQIKLLRSGSIRFDVFKSNCLNSIEALAQEFDSKLGLLGGFRGAGKITEIIDHGIKTLDKSQNKNSGLKNIISAREYNEETFTRILEDMNRETKGMVSRICLEYDQTLMQHDSKTFGVKCYEKFISKINYFYHDTNLNLINIFDGQEYSIKESDDQRLVKNKNVLKYPGTVKFIESLGNAESRQHVLPLLIGYEPENPESIYPLSLELLDIFKCKTIFTSQLPAAGNIENDFSHIFKNGGWLEIYTYIKLVQADCFHSMLNGIIEKEGTSVEGDVIGYNRGEILVFDCKNKVGVFDEEELDGIKNYLDRLKNLGINRMYYIICTKEDNVTLLQLQLETIAQEKSMDINIIFMNTIGEDNLDAKLRGILNG